LNHTYNTISQRHPAIANALLQVLNKQQSEQALTIWESKYAIKPDRSIQYFARELSVIFGSNANKGALAKHLVRELYIEIYTLNTISIRTTRN